MTIIDGYKIEKFELLKESCDIQLRLITIKLIHEFNSCTVCE